MIRIIKFFIPPDQWKFPVIILLGVFVGLGSFVIYISKAHSYLSEEPETCMNCHIMAPQYATWFKSSHREVATCVDCHVPHNNILNKYYFKAKDGLRHATYFTLRWEPQVIFIHEPGKNVVQQNCIRCHEDQVFDYRMSMRDPAHNDFRRERSCVECHRETPHGRVNSLSSVPYAQVPIEQSPIPEWISNIISKKKND